MHAELRGNVKTVNFKSGRSKKSIYLIASKKEANIAQSLDRVLNPIPDNIKKD